MYNSNSPKIAQFTTLPEPEKPELFYVNRKALRQLEANLSGAQHILQLIVDEFNKIADSYPTLKKVESFFGHQVNDFLVTKENKIREAISEIKNSREPSLRDLINACNKLVFIESVDGKEQMYWNAFKVEKDKVSLIPEVVEALRNTFRVYAITHEEKRRLSDVRVICALMNRLDIVNREKANIPGILFYDDEAVIFTPDEKYIKGFIK